MTESFPMDKTFLSKNRCIELSPGVNEKVVFLSSSMNGHNQESDRDSVFSSPGPG